MAVEDIKELKGYNKPSVYKGQKADRLISELGIGTVEDFNKLAREQGLGSFGKDKEATKFLNQLLTKAGKPNYSTVAPIQRAVEIELFGNDPKNTKMDRMVFSTRMEKISNAVQSMKKPLKEKIQYIGNMIKSYYPNISPKSVQSMIRLFSMALGPSMIGADMMSEEANKEAMSKIFGEKLSYAGGGIASINDIIKPLGYKNAGEVGIREKVIEAIQSGKGNLIDKGFFISPEDIYKGMTKKEIERQKEINKIMTDKFTVDPYEGMSEEKKEEIKRIRRIQRILREKRREERGLPDSIQLLGAN